jgi:hypothetical protein
MPYTYTLSEELDMSIRLLFTFILIFAALKQDSDPADSSSKAITSL